jgi:hypothetical protein
MELSERELLIKIEQQLKTLGEGHKGLLLEISTLFEKQDRDSKVLAVLTSQFNNHTETSKSHKEENAKRCHLHRDELNIRMAKSEGHIEKLFSEFEADRIISVGAKAKAEALPGKIDDAKSYLVSYIDNLVNKESASREASISDEISEREKFETKIIAYTKSSKIFVGVLAFLITLITSIVFPLIVTLFKHWLQ